MLGIAARRGSTEPIFVTHPEPSAPGAGEVLCRTRELGVCGTDREILLSTRPLVPDGSDYLVLGHECLAEVESVGAGVNGWRRGDLVVPVVRRALRAGEPRPDLLAFGQYTERGIVREHGFSLPRWLDRPEHLLQVDAEIASVAVLAEPLAVSEKGVNEALCLQRARLGGAAWSDPPPRVLVTGQGPIAFTALLACRCRNWPVVMYGRDAADSFRAELAVRFGARYVPAHEFVAAPADVERDGFDLILEATGSDDVLLLAAEWLAARGVLVWLGSSRTPEPAVRNMALLMRNGILRNHLHVATVNSAPRDFADALRHLAQLQQSQPADLAALITDRVSPADSPWHYQHRRPQGIKTVLHFA